MDTLQFENHFTPQEATAMLPLVRRIVEDIQEQGRSLQELKRAELSNEARTAGVERHIKTVKCFFNELEELGCLYKGVDFEVGMVDFPGMIDGREVFLCWKSDEDDVRWYHGLEDGFKGRQRIPTELLMPSTATSPLT